MNSKPGFALIVALAAGSLVACSDGFSVSSGDAGASDAMAADSNPSTDANVDSTLASSDANLTDASALDTNAPDANVESCPPPWLVTLVRPADSAVELRRFSLTAEIRRRCLPSQPFAVPDGAKDAEIVDDTTAIVAGLDGVTLINVVSGETLATFPPPAGVFEEAQTIAFGTGARLGAVAWGRGEDGRLNRVEELWAYPQSGEAVSLETPEEGSCRWPMRLSSYRGDQAASSHTSCNEVFAFNPVTGSRVEDENLPQIAGGYAFHTLPDGTTAGTDTITVTLWTPGGSRRSAFNLCAGQEFDAAPDPSDSDAVFIRCEAGLMRYDYADEALTSVVGGTAEELGLQVLSLGVAGSP